MVMFRKDMIQTNKIVPTSRISLKISCLNACNNDIDRAEKLYNFIVSDLSELPESDPVKPTGIQQIRAGADELFSWFGSHQDDIIKGVSIINGLRTKVAATPVGEVAPIPKI